MRLPELADEPKRLQGFFLTLAHAALLGGVFVVVAEDVQDPVGDQVCELALGGVAEVGGLFHGARIGDDDIAQVPWFARRYDEVMASGVNEWKRQHVCVDVHTAVLGVQRANGGVAHEVEADDIATAAQRRITP